MKLTRGGLEAGRGMARASRHGVADTKHHVRVVRPSQLIASVRQTVEGGGGVATANPRQSLEWGCGTRFRWRTA